MLNQRVLPKADTGRRQIKEMEIAEMREVFAVARPAPQRESYVGRQPTRLEEGQ